MTIKRYDNEQMILDYLGRVSQRVDSQVVSPGVVVVDPQLWAEYQRNIIQGTSSQLLYDLAILHSRQFAKAEKRSNKSG